MILAWIQAQAVKLLAGALTLTMLALAFTAWRADSLSDARDDALREVGAAETRHAVTTASLEALKADLAAMVLEGELARERATQAVTEARIAGEVMRKEAAQGEATGRTDWRGVEGL